MTIRFTTDQLNYKVLALFQQYQPTPDRRLTKERLAIDIYGQYNPSIDRKIRDAVTELVLQGHPFCATSDAPGYYIARTYEEAEQCIAELRSRSQVYEAKIAGIKRGLVGKQQPVEGSFQMGLGV